ncbi:MAG: aminoglycoside 6-adenylyltransferase [Chitinophagaceae bacterium]|nr:aminoglycoside 6-adenylyltransferase [Chitinophagaceae bacterium]
MVQKDFANRAVSILKETESVIGLAAGGSWITNELDEFSDLDLIVVTVDKISDQIAKMKEIADSLGDLLSAFTGEHVGEPRLLICLYENPLLHVDLKFLTLNEFHVRVENPVVLLDKKDLLASSFKKSDPKFPYPDYQWIEDRIWTWIHYALTKIGRGEYLEAHDFLASLRMMVLGPLLHIKKSSLPRGVRKLESILDEEEITELRKTLSNYNRNDLLKSLRNAVNLYKQLRTSLFDETIQLQEATERAVMKYFDQLEKD